MGFLTKICYFAVWIKKTQSPLTPPSPWACSAWQIFKISLFNSLTFLTANTWCDRLTVVIPSFIASTNGGKSWQMRYNWRNWRHSFGWIRIGSTPVIFIFSIFFNHIPIFDIFSNFIVQLPFKLTPAFASAEKTAIANLIRWWHKIRNSGNSLNFTRVDTRIGHSKIASCSLPNALPNIQSWLNR
jgi:hypothetical protein